jgi:steroid delta-isomerase-like uncharacterized protein
MTAPATVNPSDVLAANKALVRSFFHELWDEGDLSAIERYVDRCYVKYSSYPPDHGTGTHGIIDHVRRIRCAFPDIRCYILQIVAEGNRVAVDFFATGTHSGDFMGLPPTGRQVDIRGVAIHRVVDGKITQSDEFFGYESLRAQACECSNATGST